jgi:exodeoxyribonuclease VIII
VTFFYPNDTEYHKDKTHVSNSMLTDLKRSPKLFMQKHIAETVKTTPSKAMRIGTLLHALVLEEGSFDRCFIIAPEVKRNTTAGKLAWEGFLNEAGNRTIVDYDEYKTAVSMREALRQHDRFELYFRRTDDTHIERGFRFQWLGVDCRAKPDFLTRHVLIDVKTTDDPSPEGFKQSVKKYGYHRQAAMYSIAVNECYGFKPTFRFACVGNTAPHDVAFYSPSEKVLEQGRLEMEALLENYKRCKASGRWIPEWSVAVNPLEDLGWYDANIYETEEAA